MTAPSQDNLLARLAGGAEPDAGLDPLSQLEAAEPDHESSSEDEKLDALLNRLNTLAEKEGEEPAADEEADSPADGTAGHPSRSNPQCD